MTHVIAQDTAQGQFYVTAVNRRGELVLGTRERKEALRFTTGDDAQQALDKTPSPQSGIKMIELIGPQGPFRPTSPLGHVLQACENNPVESLEHLRTFLPPWVSKDLTDDNLWDLIKRQTDLLIEWPYSVDFLLMQRHVETDHHKAAQKRRQHNHPAERDYDTMEIVRPPKRGKHDHEDDLERLRKEVKNMSPAATKTKPKAAPRAKKEKVLSNCHCGCGGETFANFMPGHDARIYALFRKEAKGEKGVKFPTVLTGNKELFASMKAKAH